MLLLLVLRLALSPPSLPPLATLSPQLRFVACAVSALPVVISPLGQCRRRGSRQIHEFPRGELLLLLLLRWANTPEQLLLLTYVYFRGAAAAASGQFRGGVAPSVRLSVVLTSEGWGLGRRRGSWLGGRPARAWASNKSVCCVLHSIGGRGWNEWGGVSGLR